MNNHDLAALVLVVLPILAMVSFYSEQASSWPAAPLRSFEIRMTIELTHPSCAVYRPDVVQNVMVCGTSCSALSGVGILWLLGVKSLSDAGRAGPSKEATATGAKTKAA